MKYHVITLMTVISLCNTYLRAQNTMENPFDLGVKNESFIYSDSRNTKDYTDDYKNDFSNNYQGRSTRDIFYRFTLDIPMEVIISHCGSSLQDTYLHLLDASGYRKDYNDDYYGDGRCSQPTHSYIKRELYPGVYFVVSEGKNTDGSITTNISGIPLELNPPLTYIDLGIYSGEVLNKGSRTNILKDIYQCESGFTRDLCYRFTIDKPMNIIINNCLSNVDDSYLHLLDANQSRIASSNNSEEGVCYKSTLAYLSLNNLSAGTYYIVSETSDADGELIVTIDGQEIEPLEMEITLGSPFVCGSKEPGMINLPLGTHEKGAHFLLNFSVAEKAVLELDHFISSEQYDALGLLRLVSMTNQFSGEEIKIYRQGSSPYGNGVKTSYVMDSGDYTALFVAERGFSHDIYFILSTSCDNLPGTGGLNPDLPIGIGIVNYTYNVRSWLTCISSLYYNQQIYYNENIGSNTLSYNGNISSMNWSVQGEAITRGYNFIYDGLSRLVNAKYLENAVSNNKFNASYSYDKHGNMLSLSRHGNVGTSTYGVVDDLTLSYDGNQLASVEDKGTNTTLSMSMDFKDGVHEAVEYVYDGNGNMVKDLNRGISRIEYNSLNLPRRITFAGTNSPVIEYVYSASGEKLSAVHKLSTEKRTDYVGNMIYEDGSLKRILIDGGYIENGVYHFYLQDHLGNNRVVVKSDGTAIQINHYYPYGMSFAEGTFMDKQPYKYNGKELDTEYGLNLYDYGARQMDIISGRFTSVDPMAEKHYNWSPYAYCINNPINQIDPDGRDGIYIAFPDYKISTPFGKIGNLGHAGVLLINNKTGGTKYYEYGRYDEENKGIVRTISVPDVRIGKDGQPTIESLNRTMRAISEKAGQGGRIEGAYINSDEFKEMKSYAESKMAENSNPKRKKYGLTGNNCGTFAADVLVQDSEVKKKAPIIIDPRPKSIVEEYRDKFRPISYDPEKKQTTFE